MPLTLASYQFFTGSFKPTIDQLANLQHIKRFSLVLTIKICGLGRMGSNSVMRHCLNGTSLTRSMPSRCTAAGASHPSPHWYAAWRRASPLQVI